MGTNCCFSTDSYVSLTMFSRSLTGASWERWGNGRKWEPKGKDWEQFSEGKEGFVLYQLCTVFMIYAYLPVGIHTTSYMYFSILEIKIKQFIHKSAIFTD